MPTVAGARSATPPGLASLLEDLDSLTLLFRIRWASNTQPVSRTGHIYIKGIPFSITQAAGAGSSGIAAPFGTIDTPLNGASGVTGSIGVTGWALDDAGVTAIRIYREPVAGEAAGTKVFVGNAVFVSGARPDIAAAYAAYPYSGRAGWGYLMLTNMLPNQGDGTFTFSIYADDANGNSTLLGSRTITCTNSTSTTPFGAIDTPSQGQTVSGLVNNFGWVLSRGTRRADPPSGGSVTVVIDGAAVGSPAGWTNRSDLTALFPAAQYSGIGSALGVLTFDSTKLTNGVHTIAWGVTDNLGSSAGIGSRYFTVANGSVSNATAVGASLAFTPLDSDGGVTGRRGFDLAAPFRHYRPDAAGIVTVETEELDRVELRVSALSGNLRVLGRLDPLPIGSRIDPSTGVFSWQLGVGFIGSYDLVFRTSQGRRAVRVNVNPKGSNRVGPQVVIDGPHGDVAGDFTVAGWAADLDAPSGTGIQAVHVWAYPADNTAPIFLGAAEIGGKRPDVAAVYGAEFENSGYGLRVGSLSPGTYRLAVFAWSELKAEFLPAQIATVTVR